MMTMTMKDKKVMDRRAVAKHLLILALAFSITYWVFSLEKWILEPPSFSLSSSSLSSSSILGSAVLLKGAPTGDVVPNAMLRGENAEKEVEHNIGGGGEGGTMTVLAPPLYGYQSLEEMHGRANRFPSFDERVRYLMSDWYLPPCEGNSEALVVMDWRNASYAATGVSHAPNDLWLLELPDADGGEHRRRQRAFRVSGTPANGETIYVDRLSHLHNCQSVYCKNTAKTLFPALDRVDGNQTRGSNKYNDHVAPLVMQYGDAEREKCFDLSSGSTMWYPAFPIFKKFRQVLPQASYKTATTTSAQCLLGSRKPLFKHHFMPMIAKLKAVRHFGMIEEVAKVDRPWSQKRDMALFRGGLHGLTKGGLTSEELGGGVLNMDLCVHIPRCRLSYLYPNSKWIDAKLTRSHTDSSHSSSSSHTSTDQHALEDWLFTNRGMKYKEMLEYKALIMLEGNDIATGLKWALFSNSVLMIPRITLTAWAMEELLEPWVHFVPLQDNLDDAEEKMQWIVENDAAAQEIARRGTLWMLNMLYHPNAREEEEMIFDEMIRRFRKHFVPGRIELANVEPAQADEDKLGRPMVAHSS